MKKTLLSLTLLSVMATSAMAGDITLYGTVDLGLSYVHDKTKDAATERTNSWSMDSGNSTASVFGIQGSESLSDTLTVGFVLEHGFDADTGAKSDADRFFDQESILYVEGSLGTLAAGRMGVLQSDNGTFGFYSGIANPFGTGWGEIAGVGGNVFASLGDRYDNTVAYKTPTMNGFTAYAQYGMGGDEEGTQENKSNSNRYSAVGLSFEADNFQVGFVADWLNKASGQASTLKSDDAYTLNLGANYNFGVAKVFAGGQYFKGVDDPANIYSVYDEEHSPLANAKGWGATIGTEMPVAGGSFKLAGSYLDGETDNGANVQDMNAYAVSVGYDYALSKRTSVYTAAGYTYREFELRNADSKWSQDQYQVMMGLVHSF